MESKFPSGMHFYTLCPKYLGSITRQRACNGLREGALTKRKTDWLTDGLTTLYPSKLVACYMNLGPAGL